MDQPSLRTLKLSCLFCNPLAHGQEGQVLLRSDNFYLFAGIGPIVEGYIIIAPYHCDRKQGGLSTMAEATISSLDELLFLRGIVFQFYEAVYGTESGLCFEHGRAGACGISETPHCYHAHLCCYPGVAPIAQHARIPGRRMQRLDGIKDLGTFAARDPYLLVQERVVDYEARPEMEKRTAWETFAMVLQKETEVPRQYLRQLLANQAGRPDEWDWAAAPGWREVQSLCGKFRKWLVKKSGLPATIKGHQAPRIDFLEAVRVMNARAYDSIGADFLKKYKPLSLSARAAVDDFVSLIRTRLPTSSRRRRLRLLDAGCGPAVHLEEFHRAGFDCLGIDESSRMVALAAKEIVPIKAHGRKSPSIEVRRGDVFNLRRFKNGSFDAIWYSAVMVHLPRRFAQQTIAHLHRILAPGGLLYLSAQAGGDSTMRREGRFFVYYSEPELEAMIHAAGLVIVKRWHETAHRGTCGDKKTKYWSNFFLARPN